MKTKPLTPTAQLELKQCCQDVLTDALNCVAFASDASFYRLVPQAVARPRDLDEVAALFAWSQRHEVPLVFRAGGTSLSGQSITDGVLVDVSLHWRGFALQGPVEDLAAIVSAQPGVIGGHLNLFLQAQGRKIGPDPASIQSCMVGGIVANNASGMCCGVHQNSYHTLDSLVFMLPDGQSYDTALFVDQQRFAEEQSTLCETLLNLRQQLLANSALGERIRRKYLQKNTTGYSLNAFLDFEDPLAIFSHLLVGSEGTLAFIAEVRLRTCAALPLRSTGLLLFGSVEEACAALPALRQSCQALELMDQASLCSLADAALTPWWPDWSTLKDQNMCALLVECQSESPEALAAQLAALSDTCEAFALLQPVQMTQDATAQAALWKLRKGLYPSVGAVRQQGTAVIIEDVVFPAARLAEGICGVQDLCRTHGYTPEAGTGGIIFGHALDANIHFVLTQAFDSPEAIARYDAFMQDLVAYVLSLDGALKAEHGTGRNIAPFVEAEWGPEAWVMMQTLKQAVDPQGLLNPDVLVNADPRGHLQHLKNLPIVDAEVDRCTECGFCEAVCPSRRLTLTPRQRIVLRRERTRLQAQGSRQELKAFDEAYDYAGLETCATDSLCASACPVGIDTGALVKRLRADGHSRWQRRQAQLAAGQFKSIERGLRLALSAAHFGQSLGAQKPLNFALNQASHWLNSPLPRWDDRLPPATLKPLPTTPADAARFVYFPSCLSRSLGYHGEQTLPEVVMALAEAAGITMYLPESTSGHCCGLPFGSKGFPEADQKNQDETVNYLKAVSQQGHLPIVMDTSPCVHHLQARLLEEGLTVLDFVDFSDRYLLPVLELQPVYEHLFVHPVCSLQKMNLASALTRIAERCAHRVSAPLMPTCCGTAGDRGLLYPELTQAALAEVELQLNQDPADMLCASSRSCEMGISLSLDQEVLSIAHIMYAALQDAGEVSKDNPQRSPGRSLERDPERNKESEN